MTPRLLPFLFLVFLPGLAWSSEGNTAAGHGLIAAVGASVIAATVMGWLAQILKQPLLVAYIAAGVLIGPRIGLGLVSSEAAVEVIAEIGLVLLLFLIGLELDLKKIRESGKTLVLAGLLQFPLCVALGLASFGFLGFSWGPGNYDLLYISIAAALSSTAIVVKLLYGKLELDTQAGRITLGVLVFQDLWAIVVLGIQPNLANPQVLGILASFAKGALLVVIAFAMSRFVLGRLFRLIAKQPELVLIASLGWCFLICAIANAFGLSMEMGALIAGVAISTFPYNLDVFAKIINIRDFFVTLFFVALGMKVPNPFANPSLLGIAFLVALAVPVSRMLSLYPLLKALHNGNRNSLLVPLNLSQVSEFSLVIVSLGYSLGHVGQDVLSVVIFAFVITSVGSSYLIQYSHPIQGLLGKLLSQVGLRDSLARHEEQREELAADTVLLGFYRTASAFVAELENERDQGSEAAEQMIQGMVIVDFNPEMHRQLHSRGIRAVYGDVSHLDTLHHAGVHGAKVIVVTLPDTILKGTNNRRLLQQLRTMSPDSLVVCTAESHRQSMELYQAGADFVLQSRRLEARRLFEALQEIRSGKAAALRERETDQEAHRDEILS